MASSARLGLRARELLSARSAAPRGIPQLTAGKACLVQAGSSPAPSPWTISQSRPASAASRAVLDDLRRDMTQSSPKTEMARRVQQNLNEVTAEAVSMVIPGTFILPPLSGFPKGLWDKCRFFGFWCGIKLQEMLTNTSTKFSSKPTIFKKAQLKAKRSTIIPTAKALHRAMAEALASGDKHTLNKICSRKLAAPLLASIDARPRGRRYGWEIEYTKKLRYPSIKSHRMSPLSRERYGPIVRQAVVAISSKQRRFQYDAKGQVVPGSEKTVEVIENLTMACIIDSKTWTQGEWRIVGTVKPTTLEGWVEEKTLLKQMMEQGI
ncbi:hypothetical protein C8A05DRAFT_31210 [Staphylotrichum tortipilum]|uniref:Tim44-like domain-containing protein n=1 Tax=Staphylotrichum tortipilum TaxID=2831512 RepID=A0AAN6RWS4_9PEZI|nr:hypothetical protein C8A05DRAFT_31210 [Staphylotrichum longicolle]